MDDPKRIFKPFISSYITKTWGQFLFNDSFTLFTTICNISKTLRRNVRRTPMLRRTQEFVFIPVFSESKLSNTIWPNHSLQSEKKIKVDSYFCL